MAEPPNKEPRRLEDEIRELLDPFLEPRSTRESELNTVIAACAPHLVIDASADELVLDKSALLHPILLISTKKLALDRGVHLEWLGHWLARRGRDTRTASHDYNHINDVHTRGTKIVLSASMRNRVLPLAVDLARSVSERDRADIRHLLLALVWEAGTEWSRLLSPSLNPSDFSDLRNDIVAWMAGSSARGERPAAWAKMMDALRPGQKSEAGDEPDASDAPDDPTTTTATPPPRHALRTQADNPATADKLGRASFARVLAERLREAHAPNRDNSENGAFMAHIHGPWGYGKSSVLNFLRQELEAGPDPWLVVEFNAWKHHRLRPPWWSLISAVYAAARRAPEVRGNWKRRRIWLGWKLRSDFPTALSYLAVPLGALFLGVGLLNDMSDNLAVIAGVITAVGLIVGTIRTLSFGSAKAAEAYAEMKTDPYQPVVSLYCKLVRSIGRPVAVFVDDLDRCDAAYVVDLVEGIQTLLRSEPVTYVIAAERKWICSAFEKKYADFSGPIGEPARPLGYLFLDKLFQISAALPRISPEMRKGYWSSLLDGAPAAPAATTLTAADAEARVSGKTSVEALQQVIAEAPEADKQMLRAAAAVEITRPATQDAIEHSLQPFADLLEPNPRAMKRLVNAVGMAQARAFLEARDASLDTLARWTLVELRWPLLADHLAANIDAVEFARDAAAGQWPGAIAPLAADPHVRAVLAPEAQPGLDARLLRELLA